MPASPTSTRAPGFAFAVSFIVLGTFFTGGAQAQQARNCAPRADVLKQLAGEFQERTMAVGIAENGAAVIEILTSPNGSTWTLLYSMPSGISCMMSSGQDWHQVPTVAALGPEA